VSSVRSRYVEKFNHGADADRYDIDVLEEPGRFPDLARGFVAREPE